MKKIKLNTWYNCEQISNGIMFSTYLKPFKKLDHNTFVCNAAYHTTFKDGSTNLTIKEEVHMCDYDFQDEEFIEYPGASKKIQFIFEHVYRKFLVEL